MLKTYDMHTIRLRVNDKVFKHLIKILSKFSKEEIQVITEDDNPSYYRILNEYYKRTGIPSLVNTSFNMHEEPIVCSPKDAIRAFKLGHFDYLAIGNYLVSNNEI